MTPPPRVWIYFGRPEVGVDGVLMAYLSTPPGDPSGLEAGTLVMRPLIFLNRPDADAARGVAVAAAEFCGMKAILVELEVRGVA